MCLLVVVHQVLPGVPLVVAANRDERVDRPAQAMAVLSARDPRVLGGRDEVAGGTWLAVNEHGVVAGLTNEPTGEPRDTTRRSRGELPIFLARHRDAVSAVEALVASARPSQYNPCWLLVGDRHRLLSVDMTGLSASEDRPIAAELGAGVHVLENRPLGAPSAKVDHVRVLVAAALAEAGGDGAHSGDAVAALAEAGGDGAHSGDAVAALAEAGGDGAHSGDAVAALAEAGRDGARSGGGAGAARGVARGHRARSETGERHEVRSGGGAGAARGVARGHRARSETGERHEVRSGEGVRARVMASLGRVLADHQVTAPDDLERPVERSACCVHGDEYATRSALLVSVGTSPTSPPSLQVADGPPCAAPFIDVTGCWER